MGIYKFYPFCVSPASWNPKKRTRSLLGLTSWTIQVKVFFLDISVKIHQAVLHRFFHESIVVYLELLRFRTFHDLSLQKWWGVRNVEGNFFGTLPYWGVRDWRGRHLHATRPIYHGQNMVYGLWSSSHPYHIWNPYIYKHIIYIYK